MRYEEGLSQGRSSFKTNWKLRRCSRPLPCSRRCCSLPDGQSYLRKKCIHFAWSCSRAGAATKAETLQKGIRWGPEAEIWLCRDIRNMLRNRVTRPRPKTSSWIGKGKIILQKVINVLFSFLTGESTGEGTTRANIIEFKETIPLVLLLRFSCSYWLLFTASIEA